MNGSSQDKILPTKKIIITGGAGLVGHNLLALLHERGFQQLVVIDKHAANLSLLAEHFPEVQCVLADLAEAGDWQNNFRDAHSVVMLHAQIGGLDAEEFQRNNVLSTERVLTAMSENHIKRLIHISSSVVYSQANDFYSLSKRQQEDIVRASGIAYTIFRPTLMFGWFDRKHLGWLARFMRRVPIFPVPGNGRFVRQPLYVQDFCRILLHCLNQQPCDQCYNISGQQHIYYLDMIKQIRQAIAVKTPIVKLPYGLFYGLLWLWSCFDKNPPFTTQQLQALVIDEQFEVIDWPALFAVEATPFTQAIDETFNHPRYSKVRMVF